MQTRQQLGQDLHRRLEQALLPLEDNIRRQLQLRRQLLLGQIGIFPADPDSVSKIHIHDLLISQRFPLLYTPPDKLQPPGNSKQPRRRHLWGC